MSKDDDNILGSDDLKNITPIGKNYSTGAWNVVEGQRVGDGWQVGHRKHNGSKGIDIVNIQNAGLRQANTASPLHYSANWAVRLWGHDSDYSGEISHAVQLVKDNKYQLSWYQAADVFNNQGGPENYTVYINTRQGVIEPGDGNQSIFTQSEVSSAGWHKVTATIDMTGHPTGMYYLSFMGPPKKYLNQYKRGVLITDVSLTSHSADAHHLDIKLVGLISGDIIVLEKGKSNPDSLIFTITNQGDTVASLSATAHVSNQGGTGVHLQQDPYKATVDFENKQGKFVIHAGSLLAGDKVGTPNATLRITVGTVTKDFAVQVRDNSIPKPDQWTISGTVPAAVAQPTTVSLQLLKNGVPAAAGEQVDISLNPQRYLKVQPNPVRTEAGGKFNLTLTPVSPQTGTHTTTLGLSHGGKHLASYPVTTSGSSVPTAKYEIRVYGEKKGTSPLDLTQPHNWSEGTGNYVYLSVVRRGTSEEVDTARITVTLSPEGVFRPGKNTATFTRGHRARFDFLPVGSNRNSVRITFTSPEAGDAVLNIRQGETGGTLEVVKGNPLQLMSGIGRTPKGELDVRFNPPYTGGTPPAVSFQVNGHGFYVYDANTPVTAGSLTPEDPDGDDSYRIQPQLKTDASASHSGSITFFIDKTRYPEAAATYAEVTVPVSFSRVHHVQWSVKDRTVVDAGSTTLLKPALKAFDVNDKELSAYVLDVRIVATGSAGASFVTGDAQSHRLIGKAGWTPLPELHIKQNTGQFQLQASLEGAGTPLEKTLTLQVQQPQPASEIIMHPEHLLPINWTDTDGQYTSDAQRYAELRDAGHHAVHSGKVKFVIDRSNTAGATMTHPDDAADPHVKTVAVNANGRALWPDITLGNTTGTFKLTASSDGVQDAKTVTFKVS